MNQSIQKQEQRRDKKEEREEQRRDKKDERETQIKWERINKAYVSMQREYLSEPNETIKHTLKTSLERLSKRKRKMEEMMDGDEHEE